MVAVTTGDRSLVGRLGRLPRTWWLLGLILGLVVLYGVALIVSAGENSPLVTVWISGATQWVPAALFWLVVRRTHFARWDVILAAAAVTSSALGDTYYSLVVGPSGVLDYASLADVGYLLFYPLMIAAFVVLVRRQRTGLTRSVARESAAAAFGVAALLALLLSPVVRGALESGEASYNLIALVYPVLDVVLAIAAVGLVASPSVEIGARWGYLIAGLLVFVGGDIAYAVLEESDTYAMGGPLDASWALGLALLAIWIDGQGRPISTRPPWRHPLPVPFLALIAALAVLIFGSFERAPFAMLLAVTSVVLASVPIVVRQTTLGRKLATEHEVVRQLEELDKAKSEMMSTVNHELRTPLTSIRGYVELVLDGDGGAIPPEAEKMLRVVDHNAVRLESLVDDMLTISRLDAETSPAPASNLDLVEILYRVVDSLRPFATTRDIEVGVEVNDVEATVLGNDTQLERAFTNIVQNAIKFTPESGAVGIEFEREDEAIIVRVIDTGIGIPEHDVPQLFGRFFRASNAQADAVPGTGLGLAIVRALIKANNGHVTIASTVGIGTTVRVELPLAVVAVEV